MDRYQLTTTEKEATEILLAEHDKSVRPIDFQYIDAYTTFDAEFAFVGNDIVFHFFLPKEMMSMNPMSRKAYWSNLFPSVLSDLAQEFWSAKFPRLKAAYTEELNSWWLRCYGFVSVGDPAARAIKFLEKLDEQIERRKS